MNFQIEPLVGAGDIKFGMVPDEVRNLLGTGYESFKRTPAVTFPHDYFRSLGVFVYYKDPGFVEAIEFTAPAAPIYKNRKLLTLTYVELRDILHENDSGLEIESDGLTAAKLGIGAWCPDAADEPDKPAETIIVFEENYYSQVSR